MLTLVWLGALHALTDFRGSHRSCYAFLSSPGYQFSPYFQEVDYWFETVTGLKQLVHGTFMTKAVWRIRTSAGKELSLSTDAMLRGRVDVNVLDPSSTSVQSVSVTQWQRRTFDDVQVETRMLTATVTTEAWQVNVTSKPIYRLVPPFFNSTHNHGHWETDQKRLDLTVHGAYPQADAHGIIGQSYCDANVRNGKLDEYAINSAPTEADSDGMLPPMTTSAQAEGAIEGVHTDYRLRTCMSTDFKFSQYSRPALARVSKTRRTAFTSEWDGKRWAGQMREL